MSKSIIEVAVGRDSLFTIVSSKRNLSLEVDGNGHRSDTTEAERRLRDTWVDAIKTLVVENGIPVRSKSAPAGLRS